MTRDVHIEPVSNGFIVTVGCQRLVFNSIEEVAKRLIAYQKDPEGEEKKHFLNAINKVNMPQPGRIEPTAPPPLRRSMRDDRVGDGCVGEAQASPISLPDFD